MDKIWLKMYEIAREYYKKNGDLNIEKDYITEDGIMLGCWIASQRKIYKKKLKNNKYNYILLTTEQIKMLENIGMEWNPSKETKWEKMFKLAKKYYKENENLDIEKEYVTENGIKLGKWIITQRLLYRKKSNGLTAEQIKKLESIGMKWSVVKETTKNEWDEMYEHASNYYKENENLDIKNDYVTENGIKLGKWIKTQRLLYRKKELTTEQIKKLESIGMQWKIKYNLKEWNKIYQIACKYYKENGNLNVPHKYVTEDGIKLGNWIDSQRIGYKNRTIPKEKRKNKFLPLTDKQVELLEQIGMVWNPFDERWNKMYGVTKKYYQENGNLNVPHKYITEDGIKLGSWIVSQRIGYKNRTIPKEKRTNHIAPLTDEQVKLLESIGMVWNPIDEKWKKMYGLAKEYYKKYGNLNIKKENLTEENYNLIDWVQIKRIEYKNRTIPKEKRKNGNGTLTDEQVELLEKIGMVWNPIDEKWNKMYGLAKEYYKKNGNLDIKPTYITKDNIKLGIWISSQRVAYQNRFLKPEERTTKYTPLTDTQVELLERIGMIWSKEEKNFVTTPITRSKRKIIEKRFLEYLSEYIKENKSEFKTFEDVKKITEGFKETFGTKENHYRKIKR